MTAREQAKAAELAAAGHPVTASMVKGRRQRWEAGGLPALADGRLARPSEPFGRADPDVVEAMRAAVAEASDASTRTAKFVIWRAGRLLAASHPQKAMPSRAACYRIYAVLANGRHTGGSAVTRRSLAGRPQGMFGQWEPQAPGELVQVDSTPTGRAGAAGRRGARPGRADCDDRCRDQDGDRRGAAPVGPVGGRRGAAGPHAHARADAARLGRCAVDGAVGAAVRAAAGHRRADRARRGQARDRAGHHRDRPRVGVRLGELPRGLPASGHFRPARAAGQRIGQTSGCTLHLFGAVREEFTSGLVRTA
jgi:hypothetical protein